MFSGGHPCTRYFALVRRYGGRCCSRSPSRRRLRPHSRSRRSSRRYCPRGTRRNRSTRSRLSRFRARSRASRPLCRRSSPREGRPCRRPGLPPTAHPPSGPDGQGVDDGGGDDRARGQSAASAPVPPRRTDLKMTVRWNTPTPACRSRPRTRTSSSTPAATVHYDAAWYSVAAVFELGPGGTGKFNDGVNLRRGRIFFEGTLYQAVDYKFELEFINGIGFSPAGTTERGIAGLGARTRPARPTRGSHIKDVPCLGNVRIGSQKEWFSLEHLNSYRTWSSWSGRTCSTSRSRRRSTTGSRPASRVPHVAERPRSLRAIGVYKNESDLIGFGLGDGHYAVTGPLAALPVWMPDEQIFWHVGGAMSHRDPVDGQVQIRIRDNVRNAPFPLLNLIANTGPDQRQLAGPVQPRNGRGVGPAHVPGGVHRERPQRTRRVAGAGRRTGTCSSRATTPRRCGF